MDKKKQFVTPRVLQEVQVQLEKDLLQGSVQNVAKIVSMGIDVENYEFSDAEDATYYVDWTTE